MENVTAFSVPHLCAHAHTLTHYIHRKWEKEVNTWEIYHMKSLLGRATQHLWKIWQILS